MVILCTLKKSIENKSVCAKFRPNLPQNGHIYFYEVCKVCFIWNAVWLLQNSKSIWAKV